LTVYVGYSYKVHDVTVLIANYYVAGVYQYEQVVRFLARDSI